VKRAVLLAVLLFGAAVPAAAQAPARVHITLGYRYVRAQSETPPSFVIDSDGVKALPLGAEVGAIVQLSPRVSLVAAAGRSQSIGRMVTIQAGTTQPAETGKATNSLTDAMGGVELSRAATGPFFAVLAGMSIAGKTLDTPSNREIFVPSLDQGYERAFAIRPVVGVNIVPKSRRLGARLEAGMDILPRRNTSASYEPDTVFHFRLGASGSIGVGAPMPAPTVPSSARPVYFGVGAGMEFKNPPAKSNPAGVHVLPASLITLGKEVSKRIAIEGIVQSEKLTSVDWRWTYSSPYTEDHSTHRDTLLLGQVRFLGPCRKNMCFEPFAGAGFVAHRAVDQIVGDCGDSSHFKYPCEPVTPKPSRAEWQWGFAANGGAGLRINVSPRIAFSPMAQLSYFRHDESLFRDNFRGPSSGNRWAPFFGVALTIRP
jgi:hypothetical protein